MKSIHVQSKLIFFVKRAAADCRSLINTWGSRYSLKIGGSRQKQRDGGIFPAS